jgi:hypothetical protein
MENNFLEELYERFKMPWKHSAFKYYFFWIVLIFGSLGIAITGYGEFQSKSPIYLNIAHSIATTFIALIAASLVDLNLSFNIKNIPSLIINSIAFIGVSILLLIFSFKIKTNWSFLPAIIGYFLSILIWILANADNEKLSDETYYKKMHEQAKTLTKNWQ